MASIEKFLGRRVIIPEDRRYHIKQGLWAKIEADTVIFGLSEPALVMSGGINDIDWLAEAGTTVKAGQAVLFAITGKIAYIDSPCEGTIVYNKLIKESPALVVEDPYGAGWLFSVTPTDTPEAAISTLAGAGDYQQSLHDSEGLKNPEGLKGGVSGICKAVYSGIREQKIGG